jgi:hypothetical protein
MALIEQLSGHLGTFVGLVDGPESGPCIARFEFDRLPNGGVLISYEATSREHGLQHRELSMLSELPNGEFELIVSMSQSPFLVRFVSHDGIRFAELEGRSPYEIEIELRLEDQTLTYAYWWAERGGILNKQSVASITLMA